MRRSRVPTELQEQTWLYEWKAIMLPREPRLRWLHAIPNGAAMPGFYRAMPDGTRRWISPEGGRMRASGLTAGVLDNFLPVALRGYHGLYVELKRLAGGELSDEQRDFIKDAVRAGYAVEVCKGWARAAFAISAYLGRPDLAPDAVPFAWRQATIEEDAAMAKKKGGSGKGKKKC